MWQKEALPYIRETDLQREDSQTGVLLHGDD